MPRSGDARKARRLWRDALPGVLASVRHRLAVEPDERILDAVLIAEVEHWFGQPADSAEWGRWSPDLWGPDQWFQARLDGRADSDAARDGLADALNREMAARQERGAGMPPWGLLTWPQQKFSSRREEPPRRRPDKT